MATSVATQFSVWLTWRREIKNFHYSPYLKIQNCILEGVSTGACETQESNFLGIKIMEEEIEISRSINSKVLVKKADCEANISFV